MRRFTPEGPHQQNNEKQIPRGLRPTRNAKDKKVGVWRKPSPDGGLRQENAVTALRIFRPPRRARVTLRDGKPARIAWSKRKEVAGEVLWAAGPWRASGDWWEHEGWARDEWDIAVQEETEIALYRLVRDLLSGNWLVEGSYD